MLKFTHNLFVIKGALFYVEMFQFVYSMAPFISATHILQRRQFKGRDCLLSKSKPPNSAAFSRVVRLWHNLGAIATLSGFPRLTLANAPAIMRRETHYFEMADLYFLLFWWF